MIVVSFGTEDGTYDRHITRLRESCDRHGVRHDLCVIPATTAMQAYLHKPAFICGMAAKYPDDAIVWLDADAVVSAPFNLPAEGWDVGLLPNNIRRLRRHFQVAAFMVAIAPTDEGRRFAEAWRFLAGWPHSTHTDHGLLVQCRHMQQGTYRERDMTAALHGAVIRDFGSRKQNMVLKRGASIKRSIVWRLRRCYETFLMRTSA